MMKKILFTFLFSTFLLIGSDKVFALEQIPWYSTLNNTTYSDGFEATGNTYAFYTNPRNSTFVNLSISVATLYQQTGQSFAKYPYVIMYVRSLAENITVERISTCNQSCFNNAIKVVKVGTTKLNTYNGYLYAVVIPVAKYYSYDWTGSWETIPDRIDDILRFSVPNTEPDRYHEISGIYLADSSSVQNDSYLDMQTFINNASQNTQNIINNSNQNSQNIINNQNQNQQQTNDRLDNLNGSINNSNIDNNTQNDTLNNISNQLATNSAISDLITLPINMFYRILFNTSNASNSCSSFSLGTLFGTNLSLPCINIQHYLGSTIYNSIDIIISGYFVLSLRKRFISIFNNITNLRTGGNELE